MKTTVDLPDALLRQAKIRAAREGTTLRAVMTRALEVEMAADGPDAALPSWREHFGGLRQLRQESDTINAAIAETFEGIDEDAWR